MRLYAIAVFCFSLVCSVSATEAEDDEPHLEIMARSNVYNVGETRAIFCKGKNLEDKMEWYSPSGSRIEERSTQNNRIYVERRGEDDSQVVPLIIHNIKLTDGGNWTCKAGEMSVAIEFIVGEKVIIKDRNITLEGDETKSIKLPCEAKGFPVPLVFWYKDGDREAITADNKKYIIRQDNSLEIKKLNHADVGTYVCKVRQKLLSHYTDKTVHLSVQHKPVLYNNSTRAFYTERFKAEEVYAIMNETKNITCSAVANPPPVYSWFKRTNFQDSPITEEDTVITSEDGMHSIFVLRMKDESAIGEYRCMAHNTKGSESIIFHVSIGDKPHPPDFVSFITANATSITFNVSCSICPMPSEETVAPDPKNLTILGYTFELVKTRSDYSPDWDQASKFDVNIINATDTLFVVGPLDNSTEYQGRVCTRNSAGPSDWVEIPGELKTTAGSNPISATVTVIITLVTLLYCLS